MAHDNTLVAKLSMREIETKTIAEDISRVWAKTLASGNRFVTL
jgi:hypothetical protein